MEKDIIKQIILNQQEFISKVKLLPRKVSIEENGNYVFVGIRRAGKTYMLYQHIQQLLKDGHSKQEILFINFEDERITDIKKGRTSSDCRMLQRDVRPRAYHLSGRNTEYRRMGALRTPTGR